MSRLDITQTVPASTSFQASASPISTQIRESFPERDGPVGRWSPKDLVRSKESTTGLLPTSREMNEDHARQRQKARGSGGFLLQDTPSTYVHEAGKKSLQQAARDANGKERATNGDFTSIHKRTPAGRHRNRTSLGSSPLSTVIYNDTRVARSTVPNSSNMDEISPYPHEPSEQRQSDLNGISTGDAQVGLQEREPHAQAPSAIGYNTDPAQIVNLALNLSESRRRNVSGGRLSPAYINGSRRQVSSEASMSGHPIRHVSAAGANLRRHLNDQRRISRTSATKSDTQSRESSSPRSMRSSNGGDTSTSSGLHKLQTAEDVILKPSEATLVRAEKARVALELSYEYRKLLQYLPKLPSSTQNRPSTSKSGNAPNLVTPESLGRAYNPLQYIRNRKVRGRERKHLDAEAEGWKDPDRVRLWIDRVADAYEARASSTENGHNLPPFDAVQLDSQGASGSPKSPKSISNTARLTKSERQSSGWRFAPWDLLADADWLSREDNIRLVEDAKGNKLLPVQQLPKQSTPRASLEQARPVKRSLSLSRSTAPEEHPAPESSTRTKQIRNSSHVRGKSHGARSPLRDYESPRDRKGRWRRNFVRSRSPSSSGGSLTDGANGYAWGSHHDREGLDSVALEKQMMQLLAKEIDNDPFAKPTEAKPVKEGSVDEKHEADREEARRKAYVKQPDIQKTPKRTVPQAQPTSVGSVEEQRGRQSFSIDDLDGMAPNTPNGFRFGPSIFVNRSAPNSRSVSPKKPLPSRLRPSFRNRSNSRRSVSEYDSTVQPGSPTGIGPQPATDVSPKASHSELQNSDSSNNLLSPLTAELFGKRFRRLNDSSASIKAGRESKDPESRFRTLLKGGRIAELVGNEVSRVGDMIWRRDGGNPSQTASPISARAMGDSDTDGEYSTFENSPETELSRVTTNNDDGGNLSRVSTKSGQPRYHYQNLPTFRSSTSQVSAGSPKAASPEDHPITRQQMAQKARGRSSKFERLAPPKIDLRNISPSASPPLSRTQSNDANDRSRDHNSSRSAHRVRSADRRLNDVLGIPGTVRDAVVPTGLTNLPSKNTTHRSRDRSWSISRSVSNTRSGTVTKRDIARVRALLLSSGIKANEIARQAYTIDHPPFLPQLRELHQRSEKPIPRVSRAQEHLLTAKLIVAEIDAMNQQLRDQAEAFSNESVQGLHQRFKDMDERVSTTLVPQVRASADDADALSMELTTTHTLHVKRRTFADTKQPPGEVKASIKDSDAPVFPGSQSQTAKEPIPPAPGALSPTSATGPSPATPTSNTAVPPQSIPLMPPQPPGGKVQTAPPTSIPTRADPDSKPILPKAPSTPDAAAPAPPPPPPPPRPKSKPRRFRRFLVMLVLLGAFGFAGGTYYSLLSDNFHDFFTEYVPFGEDAVLYFEEREFRRRFPSLTNPTNRPSQPSNTITIPSKSGLSWKVSEESQNGSDLEKKGRHMSALEGNQPQPAKENAQRTPSEATRAEKVKAVDQATKDASSPSGVKTQPPEEKPKKPTSPPTTEPEKSAPPSATASSAAAPPKSKKEKNSREETMRPPEVNEPNRIMPTPRIDPLNIPNADEPVVQDLVRIMNDLITVVNADNAQAKYSSAMVKAKSELKSVGQKIKAIKQAERDAAENKIKETQTEFENAARELVRRLEEEMRNQTASYRDDFESEREKISQHYQERLETEIKRAREVSDQRVKNDLLEQAIALKKQFATNVQEQVETERSGRLSQLSTLSSSIEELESLTSSWNKVIDSNIKTQNLLLAVEAVRSALDNADRPKPFVTGLATLKELAPSDSVISSAIASINPTAYQRGVPTTSQLIDRFRRVASEVRKASLLPEDAGVASHAASYLLSTVMFKKKGMTVGDDVESVLTRTETLLEEGRLDEAAREVNCLDGWAKSLSADWLGEVRKVLEVRQAVEVMSTEARLLGLGVE
ncbi:MAG: hypothetical protein Q9193_001223 [Seirophora villosa]